MLEEATGTAPVGREINPATEKPSEAMMKASAEIVTTVRDMLAQQKSAQEIYFEKWGKMQDDLTKASRQNRVLDSGVPSRLSDQFDYDDIITSKATNDFERRLQHLNDRQMDAISLRDAGHPKFQIPLKEMRIFGKLDRHVTLAAGDWWHAGGSAAGPEWMPTGYSVQLVDIGRLASRLWGSLPQVIIPRGLQKYRVPVKSSRSSWRIHTETAAPSEHGDTTSVSNPGTAYIELDPVAHIGETGFSVEAEEDIILDTFAMHRSELVASAAETLDTAALNGQSPALGTLDAGNGPAAANGYGAVGLRWWGLINVANPTLGGGVNVTADLILAGRQSLGKFGVYPDELGVYLDPVNYIALLGDDKVETIDKFGPSATIVTGQVGASHGAPLFVTAEMPTTLATDGTGFTPGVTTCALVVNRPRWRAGMKHGVTIETGKQLGKQAYRMYGFVRSHVGGAPAAVTADEKHVSVIVNLKRT